MNRLYLIQKIMRKTILFYGKELTERKKWRNLFWFHKIELMNKKIK